MDVFPRQTPINKHFFLLGEKIYLMKKETFSIRRLIKFIYQQTLKLSLFCHLKF